MSTTRHTRPLCLAAAVALLAACRPAEPGLEPLEEPSSLQAAAPRVNSAIPPDLSRQRAVVSTASSPAEVPASAPSSPGATVGQNGDITLNFVDTDIREIVRTILGTTLNVNYTIDPNVHGTGSIDTPTPLPRSALLPALETVLNENGATVIQRNGVYAVVPLPAGSTHNLVTGANATGAGTQVIPLRYASAKDLAKVLEPYVAEGGKIAADPARNALIVSGDQGVRQTLVGLVRAFDIDILAGQSYALFPVGDSDPAKRASEFERVLQAQGEGGALAGIVRVVPMDRVNAVLVVSSQARYVDAARRFFRLTNEIEDATARSWHVYYVQNGQSADLELLLQRAFTPRNVSPSPAPPGTTAPGAGPLTIAPGGAPGGGPSGGGLGGGIGVTGGAGAAGGLGGGAAGLGQAGGGAAAGTFGTNVPQPQAAAEAAPPATEPLSTETGPGGAATENRIRIIANRTNNALLIYATLSEYSVIEGMLRKIDIIPLQVLIEATIAEVDLNDSLQYGTQFFLKLGHTSDTLGAASPPFEALGSLSFPSTFPGFIISHSPQYAIQALAEVTKVKVLSAPQVTVLDNQPARIQVGQQVPVLTGTATSTLVSGAPVVNSVDYHATGVIMQVTPHVNSGGLVSLDIAQEVSSVAAQATNSVTGSPTFNDETFRTRVAVQNGQTVGMAGLITDNAAEGNTGFPFLKDIPILGTLLSSQNNTRMRSELLVLITPHVIHDQRDARALTEDLRSQLINAGLVPQQLQRQGFPGLSNPNGL
jgi:general secretion pathway protein D